MVKFKKIKTSKGDKLLAIYANGKIKNLVKPKKTWTKKTKR